ncbi:hypothetical protein V6259_12720 [Marinomonas sp. TI.3.20]|uniref:hypothetical protein n=1 Tax=Marinomonas sp. TI.3.20 TaxID=3121296 RepID=UPI00311FD60E
MYKQIRDSATMAAFFLGGLLNMGFFHVIPKADDLTLLGWCSIIVFMSVSLVAFPLTIKSCFDPLVKNDDGVKAKAESLECKCLKK